MLILGKHLSQFALICLSHSSARTFQQSSSLSARQELSTAAQVDFCSSWQSSLSSPPYSHTQTAVFSPSHFPSLPCSPTVVIYRTNLLSSVLVLHFPLLSKTLSFLSNPLYGLKPLISPNPAALAVLAKGVLVRL